MDPNWASEFNDGEDEDEALRRAIALSIGRDVSPEPRHASPHAHKDRAVAGETVDLTSSSPGPTEDDGATHAPSPAPPVVAAPPAAAAAASSILGLDRKKMEEERLARMAKRKASEAGLSSTEERPQQRSKVLDHRPSGIVPPHLGQAIAEARPPVASVACFAGNATSRPLTSPASADSTLPVFPKGVVKRTWLRGQPMTPDDITIDQVLQKDMLQVAVLSSFQWDTDWLWRKVNPMKTKITLVAFAGNEAEKAAVVESARGIARLCFPPMKGQGCMHSKLQLLKFPGFLRIVVPSGNLVSYDWGETGTMENVVFIIDLPPASDLAGPEGNTLTTFGEDLCYFLEAQGLEESLIKSLRKYDFSETSRYGFVHTIPGSHMGDSWNRTGYSGLGRAVNGLGLATERSIEVDLVASSIGCLTSNFCSALYKACQGDSGIREYESRGAKAKNSIGSAASTTQAALAQRFRVYFPSLQSVVASRGGQNSAGTTCLQSRWWNLPSFPRELFRDYTNPRRVLVHSKIIFVRAPSGGASWAYVGSANLSESAWGKLVKDRTSSSPKMTCRNWESGVIVLAGSGNEPKPQGHCRTEGAGICGSVGDVFKGYVPLPMILPGTEYASRDGTRLPWFIDQH
ncbi:hypothetical protein RB595_000686 [Gaeumannomyces hyphopodioides]